MLGLTPKPSKYICACFFYCLTYWTLLHSRVIDGTPTVSGVAQTNRELFVRARCRIKAQLSHRSANPVNPTEVSSAAMTTYGMPMIETELEKNNWLWGQKGCIVLHRFLLLNLNWIEDDRSKQQWNKYVQLLTIQSFSSAGTVAPARKGFVYPVGIVKIWINISKLLIFKLLLVNKWSTVLSRYARGCLQAIAYFLNFSPLTTMILLILLIVCWSYALVLYCKIAWGHIWCSIHCITPSQHSI